MTQKRLRRFLTAVAVGLALLLALGVWGAQQFPGLTNGPKSSAEILEGLFETPINVLAQPWDYILKRINQAAVESFIRACDLPFDTEGRLRAMVRGERFEEVTIWNYKERLTNPPPLAILFTCQKQHGKLLEKPSETVLPSSNCLKCSLRKRLPPSGLNINCGTATVAAVIAGA